LSTPYGVSDARAFGSLEYETGRSKSAGRRGRRVNARGRVFERAPKQKPTRKVEGVRLPCSGLRNAVQRNHGCGWEPWSAAGLSAPGNIEPTGILGCIEGSSAGASRWGRLRLGDRRWLEVKHCKGCSRWGAGLPGALPWKVWKVESRRDVEAH
jgi:hypothetical protein